MSGIYYGLAIVAVFIVIRWYMANDAGNGTLGLLGVVDADVEAAKKQKRAAKKWTREGALQKFSRKD